MPHLRPTQRIYRVSMSSLDFFGVLEKPRERQRGARPWRLSFLFLAFSYDIYASTENLHKRLNFEVLETTVRLAISISFVQLARLHFPESWSTYMREYTKIRGKNTEKNTYTDDPFLYSAIRHTTYNVFRNFLGNFRKSSKFRNEDSNDRVARSLTKWILLRFVSPSRETLFPEFFVFLRMAAEFRDDNRRYSGVDCLRK